MYSKPKFWLRRLIVFLGISIMLVLHPSSVEAQTVNHQQAKVSLEKLFKIIKAQTGYNVVWSDSKLDVSRTIMADFKGASLSVVMDKALAGLSASYTIQNKTIVIKVGVRQAVTKAISSLSSQIDVHGRVTDLEGRPLSGATISLKGGDTSTQTDESGAFFLAGVKEGSVLLVSYLGYLVQERLAEAELGNVSLTLLDAKLAEVEINAGYYTVKDRERTGSISRITSKDIEKQPVNNVLGALIGRMSGVNIEQLSGINGGGFKVEIRGTNSLRTDARQPLYLLDGVPYPASNVTNSALSIGGLSRESSPLTYLNPNDIESIEILKDADATAIYGSRGANGVVLIKTKGAKMGASKVLVNFSQGFSKVGRRLKLLKTPEYLEMRKEALVNDLATAKATDYDINGTWDQTKYTDWQDKIIGGTASNTLGQVSVTGGNALTQFNARGNFTRQSTVTPGEFADRKGSGAVSISHSSDNARFKATFNTSFGQDKNTLPNFDLMQYIFLPPNAPEIYNPNGTLNWELNSSGAATWVNPLATTLNPYIGITTLFTSSTQLSYRIQPGLIIRTNAGYTNTHIKENLLNPISAQAPSVSATGNNQIIHNGIETWIIEPQVDFDIMLGPGRFKVLFGMTFQKDKQDMEGLSGSGYTSDLLIGNLTSAPMKYAESSNSLYNYNAAFSRLNYSIGEKYFLNLTGRRDGSSRFGPGKRFANFAAIGAAWNISSEQFFKQNLPFISFAKLRGSYGLTGSDQIPNYGYLETYAATVPYQDGAGLYPVRLANDDYSWEVNKKLESALDLGFMLDKLTLSVGWYRNRSSNQLVGYTLPDIAGFSSIQFNLPATVQNTGWEFDLGANILGQSALSWKTQVNLTIPRNKLLSYPNIGGSTYANVYTVGTSLYTTKVYHFIGVNPQNGLYVVSDLNGNNLVDIADRSPAPKPFSNLLYGGFGNSLGYKGLNLDFNFQFVSKKARMEQSWLSAPGLISNQMIGVLSRWQKPGDISSVQKYSQSFASGGGAQAFSNANNSDKLVDASFIRLKNISVSWNLPYSLAEKLKVTDIRCYLQGQNIFTVSNYLGDPESINLKTLPGLSTISLGLQINL